MNRRSFLGALAAIPFAGKAIEALAQLAPQRDAFIATFSSTWSFHSPTTLAQTYRKMQKDMLDAFNQPVQEWDLWDDAEDAARRRKPVTYADIAGYRRWKRHMIEHGTLRDPSMRIDPYRFPSHYARGHGDTIAMTPEFAAKLLEVNQKLARLRSWTTSS